MCIRDSSSTGKGKNNSSGGAINNQMQQYGGTKDNFDQGQSPCFKYSQPEPQCVSQNTRSGLRNDFVGRLIYHRGETNISGDDVIGCTRVYLQA